MTKQPLIVICGPTASGKTALSIAIAKELGCEVVSADSMQIYKGMQIATAKPTEVEMDGVKHHLIDFLEPGEAFSVADYVKLAHAAIGNIASRGLLPLVCGGTGLYINSLIDNISFDESCTSTALRDELLTLAKEKGNAYLLEMLREFDPETADKLHENNLNRIIRAIEVYKVTGITMTETVKNSRLVESPYNVCMIGINYADRQRLYDRVNLRVDMMLKEGLLEEAENVLNNDSLKTSYQAIGYKELAPYFNGEASLEDCIEKLKLETRHYAKRQLTWFRRDERINWIYPDECTSFGEVVSSALDIIKKSGVLVKE
ncbi:MAG: tRNA (adenosine(37)-N6)-dimethylallyltransferase MiaA [Oscillospiraceae bacterium]|nr:tRNA (adenosine(37)-N6)-dimethylallyltransferase MiaA [Oscillospiraceae bacterium]